VHIQNLTPTPVRWLSLGISVSIHFNISFEATGDASTDVCYMVFDKDGKKTEECFIKVPHCGMMHGQIPLFQPDRRLCSDRKVRCFPRRSVKLPTERLEERWASLPLGRQSSTLHRSPPTSKSNARRLQMVRI